MHAVLVQAVGRSVDGNRTGLATIASTADSIEPSHDKPSVRRRDGVPQVRTIPFGKFRL